MMNPRFQLYQRGQQPTVTKGTFTQAIASEKFGAQVFNRTIMQKMLPKEIYVNVINAVEGREKIKPEYADTIALAMKEWAINLGATHYSHWFQPLTGASAEKHDAFIDWSAPDKVIEKFSGKQLIQGEPDASSFPSGGLRSTYEARGYTGWDPTSPVFVWKAGDGVTLCIPSVFFSWTGEVLDAKIPLLRSEKKLNDAVLRLLKLTGIEAHQVYTTLGLEQEYFVIDRAWRSLRPDLLLIGRTVFGANPPKGQELQDHYFGSVKDRILSYMADFEHTAFMLGIPVKTRHNEVAPAQHEVAPVFEKSSAAIDHNILLMELMRQTAAKHQLACLLHEKPFKDINGSGKHSNWSISTDTGINLLDPSETPENNIHFLILITAILNAVYEHSALLRAAIGSAANDYRLGGHEAPPAIISVYLGNDLEGVLDNIAEKGSHTRTGSNLKYDLGLVVVPELTKDNTDRNRTSPFAFTGNKFEFRAVGSSSSPALPITVLNAIVADSVNRILDEVEENLKNHKKPSKAELVEAVLPVIRKYLKHSKGVRFHGDNYSQAWVQEAKRRGLPNITKSVHAFEALVDKKTVAAFQGILQKNELQSRYEILTDIYINNIKIEAKLMIDMFRTQILPAAIRYQRDLADSLEEIGSKAAPRQNKLLNELTKGIEAALKNLDAVEDVLEASLKIESLEKRGVAFGEKVSEKCDDLRESVDHLETLVDDAYWPLPKYRELLFLV
jgi:glutamine synthetase